MTRAGSSSPHSGAVAVVGSSGFVGSNLVPIFRGREVAAICRHPRSDLPAGARSLALDVADTTRLTEALVGVDTAYYLVHSMRSGKDFAARDRELTESFVAAATAASVRRIVYLGSIGRGDDGVVVRDRQPHLHRLDRPVRLPRRGQPRLRHLALHHRHCRG